MLPTSTTPLKAPFVFAEEQLPRQRLQHVEERRVFSFCSLHWVHCAYRLGGSIHQQWKHSQCVTIGLFIVVQLALTKHLDIQLLLV